MNVLDKIRQLIDKKEVGIPMSVISKYIGCHPSSIAYYLNGAKPNEEVIKKYELGLKELLKDIKKIIEQDDNYE